MIVHLKHFLRLPAEQPRPPTPQGQRTLLRGGRAKIDLKFMLSLPKALERVAWGPPNVDEKKFVKYNLKSMLLLPKALERVAWGAT